jgi:hypothetical protein
LTQPNQTKPYLTYPNQKLIGFLQIPVVGTVGEFFKENLGANQGDQMSL